MLDKINSNIGNRAISSLLLLLACFIFIFLLPVFNFSTGVLPVLLLSFILLFAAYSISTRVAIFGIGAIVIEIVTAATDFKYLHYLSELTTNVFIIYLVGSVIRHMMKQKKVNIYTLVDALNGYFLLGIMFMSLVAFCDEYLPGSFNTGSNSAMELVYYTFITLTTAGYGDITPQLPLSQSLAMIIAVMGQFYVAVVVAILVGKYASKH